MALKKIKFGADEEQIFDDAVIYKRGEYWQFRLWLTKENKYARFSLKTRSKSTAIDKAKIHYHNLMSEQLQGKTYFSITTKDGVERYLKQRYKDYEAGLIVKGRYATISTHLQHWLDFIKKDTKLKELERTDCENYFHQRTKTGKKIAISQSTVENEQSTINAMMSWLYKNKETYIDGFDFKKLKKIDRNNEAIRRATFTNEEWRAVYKTMRSYCAKGKNKLDIAERMTRHLVRNYILIAANSGLRTGEQRQLKWSDVSLEKRISKGREITLAKIHVRAETSKVRKSRLFFCRGGENFARLKKLLPVHNNDSLIFSLNGKDVLSQRTLLYHFHKIVELANIENREERDLVPYSLRHFMITQRIMSGLSYRQVAEMCGTSATQIENTYYHLNNEIRYANAIADHTLNKDGVLEPY